MKKMISMLIALCALAVSTPVSAEPWEGFYVGGFGGANFISNNRKHHRGSDTSSRRNRKRDFRTGYVVGGFLGYRLCGGFRLEGEISYRHNETKKQHCRGRRHHNRDLSQIAYLVNGYYDIDTSCWDCCWTNCGEIFPYIGVGIGYSDQHGKHHRRRNTDTSRHHKHQKGGFAWQVIAGLGYDFNACADVSIEYRFLQAHGRRHNEINNHAVAVAAKYHF